MGRKALVVRTRESAWTGQVSSAAQRYPAAAVKATQALASVATGRPRPGGCAL